MMLNLHQPLIYNQITKHHETASIWFIDSGGRYGPSNLESKKYFNSLTFMGP